MKCECMIYNDYVHHFMCFFSLIEKFKQAFFNATQKNLNTFKMEN